MNLSNYPLEKLFYFVAGVIPGFVALLIFHLASPGVFVWFFALGFLGYTTKLIVILVATFVIGNSLSTFLNAFLGMIGGIIGVRVAQRPYKPAHSYDVAPWRDPRWRALVKNHLGAQTPNDTPLMSQGMFDQRCRMIELLPTEHRSMPIEDLKLERLNTEMDDASWEQWYEHYHQIVLQQEHKGFVREVKMGLNFNLQTTSVYVLISAMFIPGLRHWWLILPACFWLAILLAEICTTWQRFTNKWSTLSGQIKYLSEDADRVAASERSSEPSL